MKKFSPLIIPERNHSGDFDDANFGTAGRSSLYLFGCVWATDRDSWVTLTFNSTRRLLSLLHSSRPVAFAFELMSPSPDAASDDLVMESTNRVCSSLTHTGHLGLLGSVKELQSLFTSVRTRHRNMNLSDFVRIFVALPIVALVKRFYKRANCSSGFFDEFAILY